MKVAILGSGAYGLALALEIYENKHNIIMWTPFEEEKESVKKHHPALLIKYHFLTQITLQKKRKHIPKVVFLLMMMPIFMKKLKNGN